ncbi:hypothetical protein ABZ644_25685, partial [Nocardiopsis alba]|uniref:hypothetical protein n=1 Tax=Nocardiopsis alba TaxID=53437 RepID=UPI0033F5D989
DEDDAKVVVRLPREWQGTAMEKAELDHAVMTRLPGGWNVAYKLRGAKHTATYSRIPRPPKKVTAEEVFGLIQNSKPTAPVFAVGPRMKPITADLVADSPHFAISMGSGAGKSYTVRALIVPMLHAGAEVHIMDIKRTSHRWVKGLKNVRVYKEVEDIHDALVSLGEEAARRHKYEDENEGAEFHPIVVVVEEANSLADELDDYWEQLREFDKTLPKNSPAFKGMGHISFGGRSASVHLIVVAQKLDARLFGKRSAGAVRENLALRLMARFTRNAWKQLADISPMAKLAKYLGRIAVVSYGEWEEAQVIYWSDEMAREYATSGVVTPASQPAVTAEIVAEEPPLTGDASQDTTSQEWVRDTDPRPTGPQDDEGQDGTVVPFRRPLDEAPWDTENGAETAPEEAKEEPRVLDTFKGIYDRGLLPGATYESARQAYSRESKKGMAPAPIQEKPKKLWDVDEVAEWWVDRQAEKAKRSG